MLKITHEIGATSTEFLIAIPMIMLLGMIGVQYTLMYNAKTNVTYAAYEAARAGAIHHADPEEIQNGLFKGLLPYLSANGDAFGNSSSTNLATNLAGLEKIKRTESPFVKIEIISPSKAAFDDFNSPKLQEILKTSQRVIPNKYSDMQNITHTAGSGLTIAEANVLKLRITYGYKPSIPLAKNMFMSISSFLGAQKDAFDLKLLAADRIPIVVDVSAQMLSPAVENGLKTVPFHPGNTSPTTPIGHKTPDLTGINLPDDYKGLTTEQMIDKILREGGINGNQGAGQTGMGSSNQDWLALLAALGLITATANANGTPIGDFGGASECSW